MTVSGGGKYIMLVVKLSFYDHFMVARGPPMLGIYRCVFLLALRDSSQRSLSSNAKHRNIVNHFRKFTYSRETVEY